MSEQEEPKQILAKTLVDFAAGVGTHWCLDLALKNDREVCLIVRPSFDTYFLARDKFVPLIKGVITLAEEDLGKLPQVLAEICEELGMSGEWEGPPRAIRISVAGSEETIHRGVLVLRPVTSSP